MALSQSNVKHLRQNSVSQKKQKVRKYSYNYDTIDLNNQKNRLCYLYLKNKTFINAHLIKNGLAKTDNGFDYEHYKRFLIYEEAAS